MKPARNTLGDTLVLLCLAALDGPDRRHPAAAASVIRLSGPVPWKYRPRPLLRWMVGISAIAATARPATAQVIDLQSVEDILIDEEARGTDIGGLRVYPSLTAEFLYNDNVFNRQADKRGDAVFLLRPAVTAGPDLDRHDLRLSFDGLFARHADITAEDSDQYRVALTGRLDLAERTTATLRAHYAELVEGRGSFGDQFFADEPISYNETGLRAGLWRRGAVWGLSGSVAAEKLDYDDARIAGEALDLSFRNLTRYRGNGQAEYRLGPRLSTFARVGFNAQRYEVQSTLDRDSQGGSALAGVIFQPSDLTQVEVGAGYAWQNFKSAGFEDFSGIDYYVDGRWAPTERMRIAVSGQRSIERAPIPETAAVVRSNFDLRATYAVTEQVELGVRTGLETLDYRGIDRKETRYRAVGTVEYRLNDRLTANASAGYRRQTANGATGREYHGLEVGVGIGFRL